MNRALRYALIGAGVLVLLAVLAIAPFFISVESFQHEIEARALRASDRELHINGGLHFTLLPEPSFTARDVTLANMPGGHAAQMVRVASMRLDVKLIPLFEGRVEVTDVVLDKPEIALEVARDGTANWTVVRTKTTEGGIRLPRNTMLSAITIRDGRVSFDNDKLDVHRTVDKVNAHVALSTATAPLDIDGGFDHQGKHFHLKTHLATLKSLTAGDPTALSFHLDSDILHVAFDGTMARDGSASGAARFATPSLRDLAAWARHPIATGNGLGALSLKANVSATGHKYGLSQLTAKLDGMTMTGNLGADLGGDVPALEGALAIDRLDLNLYLDRKPTGHGGAPHKPRAEGWSQKPISLALLKLFAGHLKLDVGALDIRKLAFGRTAVMVALTDGRATAHIDHVRLYGGDGNADLTIDAVGPVPLFTNRMTLSAVAIRPLLVAAANVDRVDATGTVTLDVTARGASPDAIMRSLTGKGSIALAHGRVLGVDLGKTGRSIAAFLGGGHNGEAVTEFDSCTMSFAAKGGVFTTGDLSLAGPVVHATGTGTIDVGDQTVALQLSPRVTLGGHADYLDVAAPVTVSGPWSHIRTKADMSKSTVTGILGNGISVPLGKWLGGLFGGHRKHQQQPPPGDY